MKYEAYDTGEGKFKTSDIFFCTNAVSPKEPYHAHNFVEIVFVKSGDGMHIVNNESFKIKSGDLIIIDYDIPHKSISHNNLVVYNCLFKASFIDKQLVCSRKVVDILSHNLLKSFSECEFDGYLHIKTRNLSKNVITSLFEQIDCEYSNKKRGYTELLRCYVIEILANVMRFSEKSNVQSSEPVDVICEYIFDNYTKKISLSDLGGLVFLSKPHLCRLFKKTMGESVISFAQRVRVEAAINFIVTTNLKISEIANRVGYEDIKYFNSIFKKITGFNPSDFRK